MKLPESASLRFRAARLSSLAIVAVSLVCGAPALAGSDVSGPAPDFTLPAQAANAVQLSKLRGQVVMINFWATWCGPCRAEMPDLVALHQTSPDLVVLEVNAQEPIDLSRPFAQEFGMTMPVLVDEAGAVRSLYGVRNMPTTLFIDAAGVIVARWAGVLSQDQLGRFVAQIQ